MSTEKERMLRKLDKNVDAVLRKARNLQEALNRDVIKALGVSYTEEEGFQTQPFQLHTELFSGEVSLATSPDSPTRFEPERYESQGSSVVDPLGLLLTQWATVLAIRVGHDDPVHRLQLTWIKKTDPASSPVFLLDEDNSEYYYPISTDLKGQVVAGHPRIGVIGFEPFRRASSRVQLHFAGIKLDRQGDTEAFHFQIEDEKLASQITENLGHPSLVETIKKAVDEQTRELRERLSKPAGCLGVLLMLVLAFLAFVAV
ncbi:MAG: hypothetical protein ACREQV_00855 [Candidatus Binatia bacterium]